jgi:predicted transglutaminase-like cysteine proteinase
MIDISLIAKAPSAAMRSVVTAVAILAAQAAAGHPITLGSPHPPSFGIIARPLALPDDAQPAAAALALSAIDRLAVERGPLAVPAVEPFGLMSVRAPEGGFATKWSGVERDIETEAQVLASCRAAPERCPSAAALRFLAIIDAARIREGRARLGEVNRAINLSIRPMSDLAQYGAVDLWTAPLATLAAGAGDCEDYAIAKYVALKQAGVSDEDLRLLIVQDTKLHAMHAVVAARLEGSWVILDNLHLAVC